MTALSFNKEIIATRTGNAKDIDQADDTDKLRINADERRRNGAVLFKVVSGWIWLPRVSEAGRSCGLLHAISKAGLEV